MQDRLLRGAAEMGIALTEQQAAQMTAYFEKVLETNKTLNLTRITGEDEAVSKHFLDSLSPLRFGLLPENARVIDVGTGAGFPGIPLAIARPDLHMTLLDARRKRVDFIREAIAGLDIRAACLHGRAEDAAKSAYDIALARAVAALPKLTGICLPLVRKGGRLIAYKTLDEAQSAPQGAQTYPANVPGCDGHALIVIEKTR